jgi:hypothetical protein
MNYFVTIIRMMMMMMMMIIDDDVVIVDNKVTNQGIFLHFYAKLYLVIILVAC